MEKLRRVLSIDEDGRMHVRHEKPAASPLLDRFPREAEKGNLERGEASKYEALSRNWLRVLTALERGASREQWFDSVAAALELPVADVNRFAALGNRAEYLEPPTIELDRMQEAIREASGRARTERLREHERQAERGRKRPAGRRVMARKRADARMAACEGLIADLRLSRTPLELASLGRVRKRRLSEIVADLNRGVEIAKLRPICEPHEADFS
jgi:hypothetical protein